MPPESPLLLLSLVVAALLAAMVIVILLDRWLHPNNPAFVTAGYTERLVFLFDDGALIDANPAARHLLHGIDPQGSDLDGVAALLGRRFPDLGDKLSHTGGNKRLRLVAQGDGGMLAIERRDGLLRLTLDELPNGAPAIGPLSVVAMQEELSALRTIAEEAPQLIWKEDATGVTWANHAYLILADRYAPDADGEAHWPPAQVFPIAMRDSDATAQIQRHRVVIAGDDTPRWYEVTSVRRGADWMRFAVDASGAVRAEEAQKNFVQTLTKTFAHLSIGLAIFDRQRRLVLFNPAFLDLSGLPAPFLSARPLVHSVLDRMRDANMLPEPRNYADWRDQVTALEAEASRGTYCETWNLPGGQTYRVTGRPHPDGAIAFLFEDISAEISLTRSFRSELETAQSILDSLDEAIAVFTPAGTLSITNAAYRLQWGGSDDTLDAGSLAEEIARWDNASLPGPERDSLQTHSRERQGWTGHLRLLDGQRIVTRFAQLPGGALLAGFRALPPVPPATGTRRRGVAERIAATLAAPAFPMTSTPNAGSAAAATTGTTHGTTPARNGIADDGPPTPTRQEPARRAAKG